MAVVSGFCQFCYLSLDVHCLMPEHWQYLEFPTKMSGRGKELILRTIEARGYACPVLTDLLPACLPVRKPSA